MTESIVLCDYDPGWHSEFIRLRERLSECLGCLATAIEHIGSTAIPGMAAKPIIDIDVVASTDQNLAAIIARLATLGYVHEGDLGIAGREAFRTSEKLPHHHLYVCHGDRQEFRRHIIFRDYLRSNPWAAEEYIRIKNAAAKEFRNDRVSYTNAKSLFIENIVSIESPSMTAE